MVNIEISGEICKGQLLLPPNKCGLGNRLEIPVDQNLDFLLGNGKKKKNILVTLCAGMLSFDKQFNCHV